MDLERSLPRLQGPTTCPYPESDQSNPSPPSHFLKIYLPCTKSHFAFPLLGSHQTISPGPRHMYPFCNRTSFLGEELLAPCQNPELEDHSLSVSETAYSIFSHLASILEGVPPSATWGRAMPWWHGPTYHGNSLHYLSEHTDSSESKTQWDVLFVQVIVHRDKLRIKQSTRCTENPTSILS
jgi:hypothetical protein